MNEKNPEKLGTFFTNEALYDNSDLRIDGLTIRTKEAVVRLLIANLSMFSQLKIEIKNVAVKNNEAKVNWTIQGKFEPESSKEKKFSGIDTVNFDDEGKIYHLSSDWNHSEHSFGRIYPV